MSSVMWLLAIVAGLDLVTWNVAAVNNNPFEYWITHPNPDYSDLMGAVEHFIMEPGADDRHVYEVFTDAMFDRVLHHLQELGVKELASVERMWKSEYRERKVVSEFLRDDTIGKKRLASMPDRVTNTIQVLNGTINRPAVINCYARSFESIDTWFEQWLQFFFDTKVEIDDKGPRAVHSLLQPIRTAKYPAVTPEEEKASVPLQVVLQGVFDAILVDFMTRKMGQSWHAIRTEICNSLNRQKNTRILEILQTTYTHADAFFLQEAGNGLVALLREHYGTDYWILLPAKFNAKRNQNSVLVLRKSEFSEPREVELPLGGWEAGDLLVAVATYGGHSVTLASFHGDTNGLLTPPMLDQLMKHLPTQRLIFGLDANTYEKESKSTTHVLAFEEQYTALGLKANWGKVDPSRYTTFNARTYLQTQLNKAAKSRPRQHRAWGVHRRDGFPDARVSVRPCGDCNHIGLRRGRRALRKIA